MLYPIEIRFPQGTHDDHIYFILFGIPNDFHVRGALLYDQFVILEIPNPLIIFLS